MDGIIVINKPTGMTSHDVVMQVRRRLKTKRVGHAGTLDPLATGVLVILVGKATKFFQKFVAFDKAYQATMVLGTKTTTADIQGTITEQKPYGHIDMKKFIEALENFKGEVDQVPPMVSAVKVNGKRLYELARRGIEVDREPRHIRIHQLDLLDFQPPSVKFYLECSKGTYVRQLAEDIAGRLDCVACISKIERLKVGPFVLSKAVELNELREDDMIRDFSL